MLWAFELRVPGLYQIEVLVGVERAEAGRDMGRLYSGKSRRLQMCPDLKLLA